MSTVEVDQVVLKVVELYHQGLRVEEIGEDIGYSGSGVRHLLNRAEDVGVKVRRRSAGRPLVNREKVLGQVDLALNRGYGISTSVIHAARMSSCGESTVWRALRGD